MYLQIGWALSRLIVLLAIVYALKDLILNLLGDPERLTLLVIGIASTPVARFLLFLVLGGLLTAICYFAMRIWPSAGYWIAVCTAAFLTLTLFRVSGTSLILAVPAIALLATNLAPDRLFARLLPTDARRGAFMTLAVGVAEIFFFRHFARWVLELWTGRRNMAWHSLPAAAVASFMASGAAVALVHPASIATVEQRLRMPAEARIVARGDFNWMEMDANANHLFVTGHGVPRLLRFDIADFSRAPQAAAAETGGAQAFAYDRQAGEIYIYNGEARELLVFDPGTLQKKKSIQVKELASGDPWLAVDTRSNTIAIVSEADSNDGASFIVLDRTSGAVRDKRDLDAGNLQLVEGTSELYLSFFRRRHRLMRYNLSTLSIEKDVAAPPRVDRLIYFPDRREVLLTVPAASSVRRYDAETMADKGAFRAIFGVRALAIDKTRKLMLAASFATGEIAIMDLDTFKIRSRHYLGPWLRTIVVDERRGVAYVSSKGFLHEFKYASVR